MRDHIVIEQLEVGAAEFAIAVPPHRVLGERVDDNVFILGAAAGVGARLGTEGAALHQRAFAASDRVLHQNGVGQIPMNAGEIFETEFVGAVGAVPHARFHLKPPLWPPAAAASRRSPFCRFLGPLRAARAAAPPLRTRLDGTVLRPISSRPAAAKAASSKCLTGWPLARSNAAVQRCPSPRNPRRIVSVHAPGLPNPPKPRAIGQCW